MIFSNSANQVQPFRLIELPFDYHLFKLDEWCALSNTSFDYHYYKHHQTYLSNLNNLLAKTDKYAGMNLEEIVSHSYKSQDLATFNNAAQVWNHNFFWHSITPNTSEQLVSLLGHEGAAAHSSVDDDAYLESARAMAQDLISYFGSLANFQEQFKAAALAQFGSGWVWLMEKIRVAGGEDRQKKEFVIVKTSNAFNPITLSIDLSADANSDHYVLCPLLCCDVWEHAYYIDYYNNRGAFLDSFFKVMRLNFNF
ncbi:Superoxide dismutase [Rickettsiales endosymbiont of Paramecium tredecaurelia]|uniref:superoxide dismutase n=1 Tax=Candidatus Sarmatiella mevalonica TaxID=2770581 RepID=UPI001924E2E4|nr:superoxide dismutase [Candidatus Sarmatiella mevalonica]MBL3284380.1 Superoxide dismutase [Candidatus Sarmatiella mevalonica]